LRNLTFLLSVTVLFSGNIIAQRKRLPEAIARDVESREALPLLAHTLWLLYGHCRANQRVAPIASLISRQEWIACVGQDTALNNGEEVYLALDLSSVVDLTALLVGSLDDPCRVVPYFWKPREHLNEHSNRDFGSGSHRYQEWAEAGHLKLRPGRTIDPDRGQPQRRRRYA
jgi:hypothetical protein